MTIQLLDLNSETDFKELVTCEWEAHESPPQSFFRLFAPIYGTGPNARQAAIDECFERQLSMLRADTASKWQKVVNKNGKIIGGALWKIYTSNPFAVSSKGIEVSWHPPGEARDFARMTLERFGLPRRKMAQRPHIFLNILFTHPEYRNQGVGSLLMGWGIKMADEMGVEMWLDQCSQ